MLNIRFRTYKVSMYLKNEDMNSADSYINYTIDLEVIGNNIRTLMKMTDYTARELERLIGCTQMTFFNWTEGKNLPGFDNLLRLAGILKTPMERLLFLRSSLWKIYR